MININNLVTSSIVITTGGDNPELKTPIYFEANEPGASVAMLCMDDYNYEQTSLKCHLQYSTDKMATWETYDGSIVELDDCTDNRVYFRADPENPNTYGFSKQDWDQEEAWTQYFKTDGSVKAGGSIQFLLESTGTRTDVPEYGFQWLFGYEEYDEEIGESTFSCSSLTSAPALPATTLADSCYYMMFQNCSSLTSAPALPAKTLADRCYASMFYGCTSLTSAPSLPATTLADSCYSGMFEGCESLTTAPALPATTLVGSCYNNMFTNCSKLASIDVSFTAWNQENGATDNWLDGAGTEATGEKTFTCPSALPKTTGDNYIPSGWTIVEK